VSQVSRKAGTNPSLEEKPASQKINEIIEAPFGFH
jgi:hypothetical protein